MMTSEGMLDGTLEGIVEIEGLLETFSDGTLERTEEGIVDVTALGIEE